MALPAMMGLVVEEVRQQAEEVLVGYHATRIRVVQRHVQVRLGDLDPGEVDVQVVAGRVDQADRITDPVIVPLKPAGHCDGEGRWLYEGPLAVVH